MNHEKLLSFHFSSAYTYFVTIATNYRFYSTTPIYKKFRQYIYNFDRSAHVFSVKEFTQKSRGLHYHVLVFLNRRLNYSEVHEHIGLHADVRIEIVSKTKSDFERVLAYMLKQNSRFLS
jgi:CRISPR/Cas system CMR-associated protein Cmr1 (group 7 of RAMP superfamily)